MSQTSKEWRNKLANDLEVKKMGTTENFYDAWSTAYDECLQEWGYQAPVKCAALLNEYVRNTNNSKLKMLDVGAGTGLVGQEIIKYNKFKGAIIYGNGISNKELDIANKKAIYSCLTQWDLNNTPYPYQDNTFDVIACIGTLIYCKHFAKVFNEWIRISKPGSIIIVSHRSDMMEKDKTYFDGFVATLKWKKLNHLINQPYLPNNSNYGSKVHIEYYIARNTKKVSKI